MSNVPFALVDEVVGGLRSHVRVGLHFHPDRISGDGRTVAEALLGDGSYKNQFESRMSNGRLSPERGGDRDEWENGLFGEAYLGRDIPLALRPKYGALALMGHSDGPSPRFGCCYFLLKPACSKRATFCFGDSHQSPAERGTWSVWEDILAALLTHSFVHDSALGVANVRPAALLDRLREIPALPHETSASLAPARILDHYIEAQVHGEIGLLDDVDALVVDPSFRETEIQQQLSELCDRYDIGLHWHGGSHLQVRDVPSDFRGSAMPALAARVAPEGALTPAMIGTATRNALRNPQEWDEFGSTADVLQSLKLLWHVLLRYGEEEAPCPPTRIAALESDPPGRAASRAASWEGPSS